MKKGLKLFVWEDVLVDYTSGVMFALAESVEEARAMLRTENMISITKDVQQEPKVYTDKFHFALYGGG